jgi:hypothetical protein
MNLRIPKHKMSVEICDDRGRIHRGGVFLAESITEQRSHQRLQELLRERRFLPVQEGGEVWFIQRSNICWVKIALLAAVDELDREVERSKDAVVNKVVLEFVDGSSVRGFLRFLQPASERRVGDYIEQSRGFIPVRTDEWLYLVNLDRVVRLLLEEE